MSVQGYIQSAFYCHNRKTWPSVKFISPTLKCWTKTTTTGVLAVSVLNKIDSPQEIARISFHKRCRVWRGCIPIRYGRLRGAWNWRTAATSFGHVCPLPRYQIHVRINWAHEHYAIRDRGCSSLRRVHSIRYPLRRSLTGVLDTLVFFFFFDEEDIFSSLVVNFDSLWRKTCYRQ